MKRPGDTAAKTDSTQENCRQAARRYIQRNWKPVPLKRRAR